MRYEMSLSLYNTHKETMEYLASIIDGAILQTKSMKKRPSHWKQSYVIKLSSHPSLKLLKQVERYMFTKKKQAELAILFQETKLKKENRFAPLKEHEVIFQDECWKNMSLLNTNGHKKYSGFLYKNHPQRLTEKKPEKVK